VTEAIPILMYHSVADGAAARFLPWTVSPRRFAEHMALVDALGYTPITVSQMVKAMDGGAEPLPSRPIVLTFDDGFQDFYTAALPVLRAHRFAATLYVVSGCVEGTSRWLTDEGEGNRPMLTWSQLRQIADAGVECGAHSHTHPQLDVVSRDRAQSEIVRSRRELEERLGRAVQSFAYPHGYHDGTVRRFVEEAGYSSACGVKHVHSSLTDDRFSLGRVIVRRDDDDARLLQMLRPGGLPIAPRSERLQTKGWRLARRTAALVQRRPRAVPSAHAWNPRPHVHDGRAV
jgi:peptidoglycan/xylan/chitin deacetylase (PgdA/CDA1 family)